MLAVPAAHKVRNAIQANVIFVAIFSRKENDFVGIQRTFGVFRMNWRVDVLHVCPTDCLTFNSCNLKNWFDGTRSSSIEPLNLNFHKIKIQTLSKIETINLAVWFSKISNVHCVVTNLILFYRKIGIPNRIFLPLGTNPRMVRYFHRIPWRFSESSRKIKVRR